MQTIEYLVARWSAWPQVYYLIVNDMKFTDSRANQAMVREIGGHLSAIEPFGTLVSAGAKRREDNPFVSPPESWMLYLHLERQSEIDAAMCDYYYAAPGYNIQMHLYYGEDWYEQCKTADGRRSHVPASRPGVHISQIGRGAAIVRALPSARYDHLDRHERR